MGTKTIGVREEVYERLSARKRDNESFTDLLDRLMDESTPDWREGFGTLPSDEADDLERIAAESRSSMGEGLSTRQDSALGLMDVDEDSDETA